ncbi:MAG: gluconate 2-dehydrogenase subunit 3 family protein [Gammaproteobacteria bacterium]|nr:gluconate 2-dehydrogenase subunit 3 family protein [Gammaproteobacteria bacterium]
MKDQKDTKRGSQRSNPLQNLSEGLNRRAFLKTGLAGAILPVLPACSDGYESEKEAVQTIFTENEQIVIETVQDHLLPEDGNGPNAKAINAFEYLIFAMTDKQNMEDGDPEFIKKGVGWLTDLSEQTKGEAFTKLLFEEREKLLQQISRSQAGENWLSLLMYYLTEALMTDPIYGGNPDQAGWQWLEHQAGFPRPVKGKTYRDFE